MTQNLQLAGLMASILGFMAVAGLTIGAHFPAAPDVPATAAAQPIPSPSPRTARRVRTPKVDVRLTYEDVSLKSTESEGVSPSVAVSEPTVECCLEHPGDEPAVSAENEGFASLALPYFTTVDEKLR